MEQLGLADSTVKILMMMMMMIGKMMAVLMIMVIAVEVMPLWW